MEPIDLSTKPPRNPRAELAGVIFLPRSIDKAQAELPGGNPGAYLFDGYSQRMLDQLEISREAFFEAVTSAASDREIAVFVQKNVSPSNIAAWNEFVSAEAPSDEVRLGVIAAYPWLKDRPDLVLGIDILEEDDRQYFAK